MPIPRPMPDVRLRTITGANWREAMMLEVDKAQTDFVPSNLFSLAQGAYEHGYFPCGVVDNADNGRMVGFVMYRALNFEDYTFWYIARFMIDRFQQGKGYGRGALHAVLRRFRLNLSVCAVFVSHAILIALKFNLTGTGECYVFNIATN